MLAAQARLPARGAALHHTMLARDSFSSRSASRKSCYLQEVLYNIACKTLAQRHWHCQPALVQIQVHTALAGTRAHVDLGTENLGIALQTEQDCTALWLPDELAGGVKERGKDLRTSAWCLA